MPTRYSSDWTSPTWELPTDVSGFLESLGTSLYDPWESQARVDMFMILPVSWKMPAELRQALITAGVQDPKRRPGEMPRP